VFEFTRCQTVCQFARTSTARHCKKGVVDLRIIKWAGKVKHRLLYYGARISWFPSTLCVLHCHGVVSMIQSWVMVAGPLMPLTEVQIIEMSKLYAFIIEMSKLYAFIITLLSLSITWRCWPGFQVSFIFFWDFSNWHDSCLEQNHCLISAYLRNRSLPSQLKFSTDVMVTVRSRCIYSDRNDQS